jgi:hypothetical protein
MKLAWLICGPSGSGKSTWVRNRAKERGARLLHHAVRTDRSLRQGRAYLFSQHRSKEPTLIWLEGADTLTTDAQAFLRRILETAAPNVEFALEVRDDSTMNPPLLSRCMRVSMSPISLRKQNAIQLLEKRGYAELRKVRTQLEQRIRLWYPGNTVADVCANIQSARQQGLLPDALLHKMIASESPETQVQIYKQLGNGASPWLLLTHLCIQRVFASQTESTKAIDNGRS